MRKACKLKKYFYQNQTQPLTSGDLYNEGIKFEISL